MCMTYDRHIWAYIHACTCKPMHTISREVAHAQCCLATPPGGGELVSPPHATYDRSMQAYLHAWHALHGPPRAEECLRLVQTEEEVVGPGAHTPSMQHRRRAEPPTHGGALIPSAAAQHPPPRAEERLQLVQTEEEVVGPGTHHEPIGVIERPSIPWG